MRKTIVACGLAALITASARAETPAPLSPADAIREAAAGKHLGKQGTFRMRVRATGNSHGHTFLNSEPDYRDRANLSVDIDIRASRLLERRLGTSPADFYKGKWIDVRGTARRVLIGFRDDYGRSTGKGYFQTHVAVREPGQITVLPAPN